MYGMLFLLVQLPLSYVVTKCKLFEPQSPDACAIMMGAKIHLLIIAACTTPRFLALKLLELQKTR